MIVAKDELIEDIAGLYDPKVKCANIIRGDEYSHDRRSYVLKINYSNDNLLEFLELLSFKYDNGYGRQYLYGIVWLEDGTWLSRYEYDGSECWTHNSCPDIPDCCSQKELAW